MNAGHICSFVRLPNVSSQLYTFSCLYLLEKKCTRLKNCNLVLSYTFKMIFPFAFCQLKTIDRLPCCSHQATTSLLKPEICTLWETPKKTWRQSFPLIVAVKCCGRFITTRKSVLYFISSKKLKRKWPIGEQLWTLFELIWLRIKVTCIVCLTIVAWNILLPANTATAKFLDALVTRKVQFRTLVWRPNIFQFSYLVWLCWRVIDKIWRTPNIILIKYCS